MSCKQTYILVIGAGPAGLAAALAASQAGVRVTVIDDNPRAGGQIWRGGPGAHLPDLARSMLAKLADSKLITFMPATRLVAQVSNQHYLLENHEAAQEILCHKTIICTGARELFIPFSGWTLPGVTGVGGLQALIKSGTQVAGERVVIAGSGPLLLACAQTVQRQNANIAGILEQQSLAVLLSFAARLYRWPSKLPQLLELTSRHYRTSCHIVSAQGNKKLEYVTVEQNGKRRTLNCDRLACGFGLIPNTALAQLLGVAVENHTIVVNELQQSSDKDIYAAGECTGIGGSELSLAEGFVAGFQASGLANKARPYQAQVRKWRQFSQAIHHTFQLREHLKHLPTDDTLICRCEGVTYGEIKHFSGMAEAKMASRCGMGSCQGKICQPALNYLLGWSGTENRPPVMPARIATLSEPDDSVPYSF